MISLTENYVILTGRLPNGCECYKQIQQLPISIALRCCLFGNKLDLHPQSVVLALAGVRLRRRRQLNKVSWKFVNRPFLRFMSLKITIIIIITSDNYFHYPTRSSTYIYWILQTLRSNGNNPLPTDRGFQCEFSKVISPKSLTL